MTLAELVSGIGQLFAMSWNFLGINIPILDVSIRSILIAILIIQLSTIAIKKFVLKDNDND